MCATSFYSRIRVWVRPLLILVYLLFVLVVIPLLIVNSVKDGFKTKDQLVLIGGLFVGSAMPFCFWHISEHVTHFTKPILQKHIIRILWMVPIYAANAWLGLIFPHHSIYMDSIRECYEAYVIYNFMKYLLNFLNLEMDLEATLEMKAPVKHFFPLCCLKEWKMGRDFVHNCKHGILQYTVVRPITTFIAAICEIYGVYGEGEWRGGVAYPYIIVVNNVSQCIAMYCLVLFYKANYVYLRPMKPLPKFLCIKAVIFFSFFQQVAITFLVYFGYIKDIFGGDPEENEPKYLSIKLQNFLICIEMFLAAFAHKYSFPHEPFHINVPNYDYNSQQDSRRNGWLNAFLTMMDISDVAQDVGEHIGVVGSSLTRRFHGRHDYYMPRGRVYTNENEYLVPPPTSQNLLGYQAASGYPKIYASTSKYGATSESKVIIKPAAPKDDGFVNANYYAIHPTQFPPMLAHSSQSSSMTTSTTTTTTETSNNQFQFNSKMKKSDSAATDKFDEEDDDFIEINVKGKAQDHINYKHT